MILGTGIDLVAVQDFQAILADGASSFASSTFTAAELVYSEGALSKDPAQHLAARYAAKEAALKALDTACATTGISRGGVALSDLEVTRDDVGRPWLTLHASAAALAERLGVDRVWLSLSHDGAYATAVVTLERLG